MHLVSSLSKPFSSCDNMLSARRYLLLVTLVCLLYPSEGREVHVNLQGISKDGAFTQELRRSAEGRQVSRDLRRWFATAAVIAGKRRDTTTACDLRNHDWVHAVEHDLFLRKIGNVDLICTTTIRNEKRAARLFLKLARDAARVYGEAGQAAQAKTMSTKWKQAVPLSGWQYTTQEQVCQLERAAAFRSNGSWYLIASVTNSDVRATQAQGKRELLEEYVSWDLKSPLSMYLKDSNGNGAYFTTSHSVQAGAATISAFYDMRYDANRALTGALKGTELAVDDASDALTPSNIAILALPLIMMFVPVAFIADVGGALSFLYVFFTDFMSAVPFIIKGVELVTTGTANTINSETWILGDKDLKAAESWVATCRGKNTFLIDGIIFIVVGVGAIIVGCTLEYMARRYMRKKRASGMHPQPLGPVLLDDLPGDHTEAPFLGAPNSRINPVADLPRPPPNRASQGLVTDIYYRMTRRRGRSTTSMNTNVNSNTHGNEGGQ